MEQLDINILNYLKTQSDRYCRYAYYDNYFTYNDLCDDVLNQLNLNVQTKDVKNSIEKLIKKGYVIYDEQSVENDDYYDENDYRWEKRNYYDIIEEIKEERKELGIETIYYLTVKLYIPQFTSTSIIDGYSHLDSFTPDDFWDIYGEGATEYDRETTLHDWIKSKEYEDDFHIMECYDIEPVYYEWQQDYEV